MKTKDLPSNCYIYAHRGDVEKKQEHIVLTGSNYTLCGKKNWAINHTKFVHSKEVRCEKCLKKLNKLIENGEIIPKNRNKLSK